MFDALFPAVTTSAAATGTRSGRRKPCSRFKSRRRRRRCRRRRNRSRT